MWVRRIAHNNTGGIRKAVFSHVLPTTLTTLAHPQTATQAPFLLKRGFFERFIGKERKILRSGVWMCFDLDGSWMCLDFC